MEAAKDTKELPVVCLWNDRLLAMTTHQDVLRGSSVNVRAIRKRITATVVDTSPSPSMNTRHFSEQ